MINFNGCKIDTRSDYGGSDKKEGVIYDSKKYMLKYASNRTSVNDIDTSYVNNVISEYIGSHIFQTTGIPTHNTELGTYNGHLVVGCENFLNQGEVSHEFAWFMRKVYDSGEIGRIPKLDQVYDVINSKIDIKEEAIARFWDTFVVDALTGNFDRHKGNWSYIYDQNDCLKTAPVYDCGSTLFPALSEEGMKEVLSDNEKFYERVFLFPKAALDVNGVKVGYYDMLASDYDHYCTEAVLRMIPQINMDQIHQVIDETPLISDTRKDFYKAIVDARKKHILDAAYTYARNGSRDEEAFHRVSHGISYDKKMFEDDLADMLEDLDR